MEATLLYDGRCRLCRFAARTVMRLDRDRALAILPFDDAAAQSLLESIPEPGRLATWHLVAAGRRSSGGAGVIELIRLLAPTRPLAPVLRLLPLEAIYDLVSRHRGRLGRLVPDGPPPRRLSR